MMNPNAQAWVEALCSGDYKQGRECLQRTEGGESLFCCLGVACKLFTKAHPDKAKWVPGRIVEGLQTLWVEGSVEGEVEQLPPEVCEWLGLAKLSTEFPLKKGPYNTSVMFIQNSFVNSLMALNDNYRYSFEDIAYTIHRYKKGIFNAE